MWFPLYIYFQFPRRRYRASFIAFCNVLRQMSPLLNVTVAFGVKRRSSTLFPVLPEPEVVSNGQTVASKSVYCIKVD